MIIDLPSFHFEKMFGLDVKRGLKKGNYKVSILSTWICFDSKRINYARYLVKLSEKLNDILSNIHYPFDVVDFQLIYRPEIEKSDKSTLGVRVSIYFQNEEDWIEFKNIHEVDNGRI